jgi:hypothetical protein
VLGTLVALGVHSGCGAPCPGIGCFPSVRTIARIEWDDAAGEFEFHLCHGAECEDKVVIWPADATMVCNAGSPSETSACVKRLNNALEFTTRWQMRDGLPSEKTFSVRVVERKSRTLMFDDSAEAQFSRPSNADGCGGCSSASIDFNAG